MAAARMIAAALDRDERTVFRILDDYERVAQLPAIVLEAIRVQNIDPAARKHAALVENLLQMREPETREEARAVVAGAVQEQVKRKQQKRKAISKSITTDIEEFANKVVRQFQERYRSAPLQDRDEEIQYILELVVNTLQAPIVELRQFSQPALVPKPFDIPVSSKTFSTVQRRSFFCRLTCSNSVHRPDAVLGFGRNAPGSPLSFVT